MKKIILSFITVLLLLASASYASTTFSTENIIVDESSNVSGFSIHAIDMDGDTDIDFLSTSIY
ncbi:MAG: hypothetical protein GQ534_06250 [Candidatus Delongbacteria bacterium]|nr:hypothetical protein [Candidatus Delongbacteria bacterium]